MSNAPIVTRVTSDSEREEVQQFLGTHLDISASAIPRADMDSTYDPVIVATRGRDGTLAGAALANRPQMVVAAITAAAMGLGETFGHADSGSIVLNFDLLAVRPDERGNGLGRQLVNEIEAGSRLRGAKIIFGNVVDEATAPATRKFYASLGYRVLERGEGLPPFLGRSWVMPQEPDPLFWFWKRLPRVASA